MSGSYNPETNLCFRDGPELAKDLPDARILFTS
jgi:hypothetical protein